MPWTGLHQAPAAQSKKGHALAALSDLKCIKPVTQTHGIKSRGTAFENLEGQLTSLTCAFACVDQADASCLIFEKWACDEGTSRHGASTYSH